MCINSKAAKIALVCSLGLASLFGLFSLIFYFGNWSRLAFVSSLGLFIGLVAAPEFEPKAFKSAWVLQLASGLALGLVAGFGLKMDPSNMVASVAIGGFLGFTASFWVKHVPVP